MATKTEYEVDESINAYVKDEETLKQMKTDGQLKPFSNYFTPDESEVIGNLLLEKVYSSTNSVVLDNLDLNADKEYIIEVYTNASSGGGEFQLKLNEDSTTNVVAIKASGYSSGSANFSKVINTVGYMPIGTVWTYTSNYRIILSKDSLNNIVHCKTRGWGCDSSNTYLREYQSYKPMSKNVTKITIYSSAITFNSMFVRIYRLGD
jgi:hypothetical protein